MGIRFFAGLSLLIMLASYGCGGGTSTDIKEAQKAMELAKSIHADELAPADFQQGQKAWDHAQTAIKEGKKDVARVLIVSAKIYFNKSATIAKSKRDALSRELSAMQLLINSTVDEVKNDLSKNNIPPAVKGEVKAITAEVEKGKASIEELVNQQDFPEAVAKAKDMQTKIYNAQLILAGQRPGNN